MFDKFRRISAAGRLLEEAIYEQVVDELENGQRRTGLWEKALANSDGLEEKAKALYIQYRVQSIKDEIEVYKETKKETGQQEKEEATPAPIQINFDCDGLQLSGKSDLLPHVEKLLLLIDENATDNEMQERMDNAIIDGHSFNDVIECMRENGYSDHADYIIENISDSL